MVKGTWIIFESVFMLFAKKNYQHLYVLQLVIVGASFYRIWLYLSQRSSIYRLCLIKIVQYIQSAVSTDILLIKHNNNQNKIYR